MIQVFRVLGQSSPSTFFVAASILDRYFQSKADSGIKIDGNRFFLIGIVTVFLASKFEDVKSISLKQCIESVGRGKFSQNDIIETETDILKSLCFCLACPHNIYSEASIKVKNALMISRHYIDVTTDPSKKEEVSKLNQFLNFADRYLLFLSVIVTMSPDLRNKPTNQMAAVIGFFTIKLLKRKVTQQLQTCERSDQHALLSILSLILSPAKTHMKFTYSQDLSDFGKLLFSHYMSLLHNISSKHVSEGFKNVRTSFPDYFCQESDLNPIYRLH